jgi:hypothetical protein
VITCSILERICTLLSTVWYGMGLIICMFSSGRQADCCGHIHFIFQGRAISFTCLYYHIKIFPPAENRAALPTASHIQTSSPESISYTRIRPTRKAHATCRPSGLIETVNTLSQQSIDRSCRAACISQIRTIPSKDPLTRRVHVTSKQTDVAWHWGPVISFVTEPVSESHTRI